MEIDSVDVEISEQKKNHFSERDKCVAFALIDSIVGKKPEINGTLDNSVDSENNLPGISVDESVADEVSKYSRNDKGC